jgi:hypothetical protein
MATPATWLPDGLLVLGDGSCFRARASAGTGPGASVGSVLSQCKNWTSIPAKWNSWRKKPIAIFWDRRRQPMERSTTSAGLIEAAGKK